MSSIRIPRRLAASVGLLAAIALPAPALAGTVVGGSMTMTLTAHTASALSHGGVLTWPVGPVTVKGSSTATGDPKTHVAVVKTSKSFALGFPISSGFTTPETSAFVSSNGGFGFASIVRGQAAVVTQLQASFNASFPGSGVVLATFGSFEYGSAVLFRLDLSHARWTVGSSGVTIANIGASLTQNAAQALNQAIGPGVFGAGSKFATPTIKTREG